MDCFACARNDGGSGALTPPSACRTPRPATWSAAPTTGRRTKPAERRAFSGPARRSESSNSACCDRSMLSPRFLVEDINTPEILKLRARLCSILKRWDHQALTRLWRINSRDGERARLTRTQRDQAVLPVGVHSAGRYRGHHIRLRINLAGVERQKSRHRDPRVA